MNTNTTTALTTIERLLTQAVPNCPQLRVEATGSPEWARVTQLGLARFNDIILEKLQELYVTEQDPDALYSFFVKIDH